MSLKLTFVISSLSSGGAEHVMSIMANYWAKKNWNITIITLDSPKSDFYELHPNIKRIALGLMSDSSNSLIAIKNNVSRLIRLRREIKSSKPDIVISFMDRMNIMTLLATRGLGLKVAISERTDPAYHDCGRIWSLLRNLTYPWADAIVVQSNKVRQWIEGIVKNGATFVIPNPICNVNGKINIDQSYITTLRNTESKRTIVAMGRLSAEKGFDLLLNAFAKTTQSHPNWCLIVLGDGKDRDTLKRLGSELGVAERVSLPGRVKEPMQFLLRADMFVLSSRYEGFPNALLEAMACGLPVVSFDCPSGPREIIRNGIDGLLVAPEDVNAMSMVMGRLMSDETERKRLALRAVEVTERFGLEKVMKMWEELLNRCQKKTKILFLIRSLNYGGAQRQLVTLVKGLHERGHQVVVAAFYQDGPLEQDLHEAGVPVIILDKRKRWDVFPFLWRLICLVHREKPDILHGYLFEANLLTTLLKPMFPRIRMIWGVRASNMDLSQYDWLSRLLFRVACFFSRFADIIIVNSNAGRDYHQRHGFPNSKMVVIPNGIDTEIFKPDAEARIRIRAEWGIKENEILIGLVARLDPMKDHPVFLRAAAILAKDRGDVRFVCIGDGPEPYKTELKRLSDQLGLENKLLWAGLRSDMSSVYSALDIATSSSSYGEGFPNVIGEAMACGVPCVVTDVGDSAWITGNAGIVAPPKNPELFAQALVRMLDKISDSCDFTLRELCRRRIVENFSVSHLITATLNSIQQY